MKIFIILFFFFTCSIFPQEMISLYKKYLPTEILTNDDYRKMVSVDLEVKGNIHPDLIYYCIAKLQTIFSAPGKSNFKEINELTWRKENHFLAQRFDWAKEQNKKFYSQESSPDLRETVRQYFEPLLKDSISKNIDSINVSRTDNNLLKYFSIIFITKDTTLAYNPSCNYAKLWSECLKQQMQNYEILYQSIQGTDSDFREEINDLIIKRWYIFYNTNYDSDEFSTFHDAYQIMAKILANYLDCDYSSRFSIQLGYCFFNNMFKLTEKLPVTYSKYPSWINQLEPYNDPVNEIKLTTRQFVFSLGYKLFLKKYLGPLSYINLQFVTSLSVGKSIKDNLSHERSNLNLNGIDIIVDKGFQRNRNTVHSLNTYVTKINLPVFAFTKAFYLEFAVNYAFIHLSSFTDYKYQITKIEGYWAGPFQKPYYYTHIIASGDGEGILETTKNYSIFFPTLEIAYEYKWGIQLRAIYNFESFLVMCGLSF